MSGQPKICEEKVRKQMLTSNSDRRKVLYDRYGPEVYGQFKSFCREDLKAKDLTQSVFDMAVFEVENHTMVKGSLLVWLMNISRKVARAYLLDYSVKKSGDDRCIRRLVVSEGFSLPEAARILGISTQQAIVGLRAALKG